MPTSTIILDALNEGVMLKEDISLSPSGRGLQRWKLRMTGRKLRGGF